MRRLIKYAVLICLGIILASTIARSVGRSQSSPQGISLLHFTECQLPCWIGIQPGKTTAHEAVQQLERHFVGLRGGVSSQTIAESITGEFSVSVPMPANSTDKSFNRIMRISIYADQGITTWIGIPLALLPLDGEQPVYAPTLGDFVARFGSPSCIMISGKIWKLFYIRDEGMAEVHVYNDTLALMHPVRLLALYAPNVVPNTCTSRWRGFTHQARYLTP